MRFISEKLFSGGIPLADLRGSKGCCVGSPLADLRGSAGCCADMPGIPVADRRGFCASSIAAAAAALSSSK